jgi:phytoene dehydrogenase-like protein
MADVDAIVIGAGHNGLAAAATLAKENLEVLVLEKQRYVGGMAGTTDYFLVRAVNACAVGTYGEQSDTTERLSSVCP